MKDLLDRKGVATLLNTSRDTIDTWYKRNQLPKPDLVIGDQVFWKPKSFTNWKTPAEKRSKSLPK